jgi:hypothetical protein
VTEAENLLIAYRIGHRFDMKLAAVASVTGWIKRAEVSQTAATLTL